MTIAYDDASGPGTTSAQGGGTTPFMAPELLSPSMFRKTKCQVSREADVYAFGMVILQVLTGLMPFQLLRETEISYKVIQGERPQRPGKDSGISNELWQLLNRCWSANCAERPQIVEILQRLCVEPARGLIFPPSKVAPAPSCESEFPSATQRYGKDSWLGLVFARILTHPQPRYFILRTCRLQLMVRLALHRGSLV